MNTAAKGFIELGLNPHRTVAIIGKVKQNFQVSLDGLTAGLISIIIMFEIIQICQK